MAFGALAAACGWLAWLRIIVGSFQGVCLAPTHRGTVPMFEENTAGRCEFFPRLMQPVGAKPWRAARVARRDDVALGAPRRP